MKRILYLLMSVTMIIGVSCEGEEGPIGPEGPAGPQGAPGPAGLPGQSGTGSAAKIYDFNGFAFNAENEFSQGIAFADYNIEVAESDLILVYNLFNALEDEVTGEVTLVWEPLPLTVFDSLGIFHYKFIHTDEVIVMLMDANFELEDADIESYYTEGLAFRIVVVPGEIIPANGRSLSPVNYNNFNDVINYFKLDEEDVIELNVQ